MNTVNIVGRMCADPELKTTQSGISVCSYDLAVKRPNVKDTTDFLKVVSWRGGAEYIAKYAHKGDMVAVSGVLTVRKWEDKDGKKRDAYEIVSNTVEIISSKKPDAETSSITQLPQYPTPSVQYQQAFSQNQQAVEEVLTDEDLPF